MAEFRQPSGLVSLITTCIFLFPATYLKWLFYILKMPLLLLGEVRLTNFRIAEVDFPHYYKS